jgi:hypothetical protein
MPEPSNYALLDQRKRDERRLAKKRKQVEEELARRRNGPIDEITSTELDGGILPSGTISQRTATDSILGLDTIRAHDGQRLSRGIGTSITESISIQSGIDETMKRRNDEAFILILANL